MPFELKKRFDPPPINNNMLPQIPTSAELMVLNPTNNTPRLTGLGVRRQEEKTRREDKRVCDAFVHM